uniref:Peptidyl-prolyl cis-trans isomerase n=1 Tax=Amphilophus citrinellus TaxID=61819 RepID=A0A3Q0TI48_AMPCI
MKSKVCVFNSPLACFHSSLQSELKLLSNPTEVVIISFFLFFFLFNLVKKAAPQICSCTITIKGHFSGGCCSRKKKKKKKKNSFKKTKQNKKKREQERGRALSPAENVRALSAGERGFGHKEPVFFRVILQFLCQEGFLVINYFPCGDKSICGRSFPDENFKLKHTGPGDYPHLLQMRVKAMWCCLLSFRNFQLYTSSFRLNGKHVVFGRVKEGMDVAKKMECFFVHRIGTHQRSSHITDCVELKQIYSLIAEPK